MRILLIIFFFSFSACENRVTPRGDASIGDSSISDTIQKDIATHDLDIDDLMELKTNQSNYQIGDEIDISLKNSSNQTLWLNGCFFLDIIERQENGEWNDYRSFVYCGWEGYATPIIAGSTESTRDRIWTAGTYRIKTSFGMGCSTGEILSDEHCAEIKTIVSAPFKVKDRDCFELEKFYDEELRKAISCNPAFSATECKSTAMNMLYCGCPVFVTDSTLLNRIQKAFDAKDCAKGIACQQPQCQDLNDGLIGICMINSSNESDSGICSAVTMPD